MLPNLCEAATSEGLVDAVARHLEQTREHAARLEDVFRAVGAEPSSNLFPPLEKLSEHHDRLSEKLPEDRLADVFHAAAAATGEHVELAAYGALLALADALELPDEARGALERNRREDAEALERLEQELRRLAAGIVQARA